MKVRSLISLFLLLCFGLTAKAEDELTKLIIWLKDGDQIAYALSEKPSITFFLSIDLVVTTQDAEVFIYLDNIERITYETIGETAVRGLQSDNMAFKFDGETLLFPSLREQSIVKIVSANGNIIFEKTVQIAGEYYFPLSALESGTYIVTVNSLTYKIMKK